MFNCYCFSCGIFATVPQKIKELKQHLLKVNSNYTTQIAHSAQTELFLTIDHQ